MTLPNYLQEASRTYRAQKYQQALIRSQRDTSVFEAWNVEAFKAWAESNFHLADTGELITLYDVQLAPLQLLFQLEHGRLRFNTLLWSWPKKSAKSSIVAALVDWFCEHHSRASIKLVANDLKQADSRVGLYLRESIRISQRYGKRKGITITPSGYKIEYPNGSRVESVPIDPRGEAGGNDDLIVYSELWGWKSKAHQQMWSEMTLSPTKYGKALRIIDTYAGYKGESPVLEHLYETGKTNGEQVLEHPATYANERAKLLTVWATEHYFPWQTAEYYQEENENLVATEMRRIHGNEWVDSVAAFIPIEWWDACEGEIPAAQPGEVWVLGVDAAVSDDCFAIVGVTRRDRLIYPRYVRVWKPEKGYPLDHGIMEAEIERLCREYPIQQIAYDKHQLHGMMTRIKNKGLAWVDEFKQGDDRLIADKGLYDLIKQRQIVHQGDSVLKEHMKNAFAETDKETSKLRIVKGNDTSRKIDSVVALSMACHRAMELNIG